jgi:hypothetical protein
VWPYPLSSIISSALKDRQPLPQTGLRTDPKTLSWTWALQQFLPCYLAKETIGYTPAPSALPQDQLGMPCASLGFRHNKPSLKLSHQSPQELYKTRSESAGTAASPSTRRMPTNVPSGSTLSMPIRSKELGKARPLPFPAMTQTPMTSGTIPSTSTTDPNTGAAHASTSTSSEVPQTSLSTSTNPTCSSGLDEHRSAIQITVDELEELMERFRALSVEQPANTFTIILLML